MAQHRWHRSLGLWLAWVGSVSQAQGVFPARELAINGIFADRHADSAVYCLLGRGACQPPEDTGAADVFIREWIAAHPKATATPISAETRSFRLPETPMRREIYVWIQDGSDSLAAALVGDGFFPAAAFEDMLERDRKFMGAAQRVAPKQKSASAYSGPPRGEPPHRLVADGTYINLMQGAAVAETRAKGAKKRIWSGDSSLEDGRLSLAAAMSRQSFSVRELHVSGVYAHRFADADVYCLLGDPMCSIPFPIPPVVPGEYDFIARWMRSHPDAVATPISVRCLKRMQNDPPTHSTYVWIEDRGQSLNVELVREGFYKAAELQDVIAPSGPILAPIPTDNPAQVPEFPELDAATDEPGLPLRLVSRQDYSTRMGRAEAAEREAQQQNKGLWSDAEAERWNPPSDAKMMDKYRERRQSFSEIVALAGNDPRLLSVNRDPKSWSGALKSGVSKAKLQKYTQLLERLDVNRDLANVVGIGKVCLITTDIVYGLFDSGVIKGYVWSPNDPSPLVADLENQTPTSSRTSTGAPISYRHIDDGWYLFELVH